MALCVRMSVAGANKVEGTINMPLLVKKGLVETSQCFRLLLRLKVFRSVSFKYVRESYAEYSIAAV